ncbi:toll/interleukin-1 receptor domain-containing protein [Rhodopirellula europaea]|uniref:toll/interleukin-1 receptor domain-containing protein n=1 Tax=Rhodopirellula europaea TaxID=1263866 RepID=UPI003D2A8391
MPDFATYDDLRRFNRGLTVNKSVILEGAASTKTASVKDTFLSHSSKDAEFLPAVINLLQSHGASVYCDLDDARMPEDPNPETASIIKGQIKRSDRLVLFVTKNSKDSKWVPWELGIGDAALGESDVALFPAADHSYEQTWAKQEYLGIYRHIVWGKLNGYPDPLWMVYDYRANTADRLSDWCRSKRRSY